MGGHAGIDPRSHRIRLSRLCPKGFGLALDTAPEYFEHKRFPPVGECVYCGARPPAVALTDEHIIPFSLGGNVILPEASCKACAAVTADIEGHVGRKVLWDFRVHAKIPTRRPKERPDVLPATISIGTGEPQRMDFAVADHPYFTPLPVWGMPGALIGAKPSTVFQEYKAHVFYYVPPGIRETLKLSDGDMAQIHFPDFQIDHHKFARAMAKMAYCQAVARWGLRGFRRLVLPDLILGKYPCVPHLVGCALVDPPPPHERKVVHVIDLRVVTIERMRLIVGSVRLFANSGTKEYGTPLYRVIVGAPKDESLG